MKIGPGLVVPAVAELVVLVLFAADVLGDTAWPDGLVVPLRLLLVVAAFAVAVAVYVAWSRVAAPDRTTLVHVAAAGGLLGGAAVASAVTTADAGRLLGSTPLATFGTIAIVVAVVAHQIAAARRATA